MKIFYTILLLILSTTHTIEECPFSGLSIVSSPALSAIRAIPLKTPPSTTSATPSNTLSTTRTIPSNTVHNKFFQLTIKTISISEIIKKAHVPEITQKARAKYKRIHKNSLDPYGNLKDFSRIDQYKKGILRKFAPDVVETIAEELGLTDEQMESLIFLYDTSTNVMNAWALSRENVVIFSKEYYEFARCGLNSRPVFLDRGNVRIDIPPKIALHIFLAICSHEIEHIKRKHVGRDHVQQEIEADTGVLAKHTRAFYIKFSIQEAMLCFNTSLDDPRLNTLLANKEPHEDAREYLFNHHADDLYHLLYPNPTHPSHTARKNNSKERALVEDPNNTSEDYVIIRCPNGINLRITESLNTRIITPEKASKLTALISLATVICAVYFSR